MFSKLCYYLTAHVNSTKEKSETINIINCKEQYESLSPKRYIPTSRLELSTHNHKISNSPLNIQKKPYIKLEKPPQIHHSKVYENSNNKFLDKSSNQDKKFNKSLVKISISNKKNSYEIFEPISPQEPPPPLPLIS